MESVFNGVSRIDSDILDSRVSRTLHAMLSYMVPNGHCEPESAAPCPFVRFNFKRLHLLTPTEAWAM